MPPESNLSEKAGLAPGSLYYIGHDRADHDVVAKVIDYNREKFEEKIIIDNELFKNCLDNSYISWLNVDGVHNVDLIRSIGTSVKLHPLILEDILNTKQRPKLEIHDDYIYATLKMITYNEQENSFEKEQISIVLTDNLVITFQQHPADVFDELRKRLKDDRSRIRKLKADYLFYSVIDSIVDGYFKIIEQLDLELEKIEDTIDNDLNIISDVHSLKKELLYIRRSISPVRDMISTLQREDTNLINQKTLIYLKDVQDHCIQVHESVELIRDIVSGLIEIHLSRISNRMNEIMKYLTVFSSIFIPLTFVTGIYGMNFDYMPELKWKYGYFTLMGALLCFGLILFTYFKKKKWL